MNRPGAVLALAHTLDRSDGGPARAAIDLAHLVATIEPLGESRLCYYYGSDPMSRIPGSPASIHRMPWQIGAGPGPNWIAVLVATFKSVKSSSVVTVHGFYLWWVPIVLVIATMTRKRVFICPHGSLTSYQSRQKVTKKLLFRATTVPLVHLAGGTFVVASNRERTEMPWTCRTIRSHVIALPVPILDAEHEGGEWHDPISLVSVSRIAHKKRIDISVRTVAELRSRGRAARLEIFGEGDPALLNSLQELSRDLGVDDCVTFRGQVDATRRTAALLDSDVFLLPSEDENFGIAAAEALAAGVPVVASTRVDALAGLPAECGTLLVEPTPERIAQAIVDILENCSRTQTGRACRAEAQQRFAPSLVRDAWRRLILGGAG